MLRKLALQRWRLSILDSARLSATLILRARPCKVRALLRNEGALTITVHKLAMAIPVYKLTIAEGALTTESAVCARLIAPALDECEIGYTVHGA
jgi:hypothetical protein